MMKKKQWFPQSIHLSSTDGPILSIHRLVLINPFSVQYKDMKALDISSALLVEVAYSSQSEDNFFTNMSRGLEAGS